MVYGSFGVALLWHGEVWLTLLDSIYIIENIEFFFKKGCRCRRLMQTFSGERRTRRRQVNQHKFLGNALGEQGEGK